MIDQDMAGAQDTIYLCNFRVSVDGEWLCLKELQDVEFSVPESSSQPSTPSPDEPLPLLGMLVKERSCLLFEIHLHINYHFFAMNARDFLYVSCVWPKAMEAKYKIPVKR
jgi:hypothetical protein